MKSDINFISSSQKGNIFNKSFFLGSLGLFSLIFLIAVSIIIYRITLNVKFSNLDTEYNNKTAQINTVKDRKVKLAIIHDRLADAVKIKSKRPDINSRVVAVQNIIPNGVSLQAIETKANKILFSVSSTSLSNLNLLIEQKILSIKKVNKNPIKRIQMDSFGLNAEKLVYTAAFTIEF